MSDKAVAHRCKNDLLDFTCFFVLLTSIYLKLIL